MVYNERVLKLATTVVRTARGRGGFAVPSRGIGVKSPGYTSNRNFARQARSDLRLAIESEYLPSS